MSIAATVGSDSPTQRFIQGLAKGIGIDRGVSTERRRRALRSLCIPASCSSTLSGLWFVHHSRSVVVSFATCPQRLRPPWLRAKT